MPSINSRCAHCQEWTPFFEEVANKMNTSVFHRWMGCLLFAVALALSLAVHFMSPSSFALLGMILFISLTSGVVLGYNLIKPRPKCFFTFGDPGTLHLHQHEPMLPYLPPCAVREGDAGFGSEQIVRPRDQLILEVRFDRLWPSAYLYGLGNVPWEVNIDQRMSHLTLHDHSGDALIIRFITRGGKDIFLNEAGLVLALQHIGTFRCLADGMSQALSTEIPGQIVKLPNDNASAG